MKHLLIGLFSIFASVSLYAADGSYNTGVMSCDKEKIKADLLKLLKAENPHVSPSDTTLDRLQRNAQICCSNPLGFYSETERDRLLLSYVADRDLMLNGEPLLTALGPEVALEMREVFEADQKEHIKEYRRAHNIPEHPGLQKLYYIMSIYGCAGFTDMCTPVHCIAAQTCLGCWTT